MNFRAEEEGEDKCQGDVLSLEEWRKERRGGEMDAPTLTTSVSEVSLSLQSQVPRQKRNYISQQNRPIIGFNSTV